MFGKLKPIIITIILGIGYFALLAAWRCLQCHRRAEIMDLNSDYDVFNGCFVNVNGKYIHEKNYRLINSVD